MQQPHAMTGAPAPSLDGTPGMPLILDQVRRAAMSPAQFECWLEGVLPDIKPDVRVRVWRFLECLLDTGSHKRAMHQAGVTWAEVFWAKKKNPAFDAEYQAVTRLIECQRQIERAEEADRRGVDGWLEPVYGRATGKDGAKVQVGTVRRFSDRALELQLKAGDKARYSERVDHAVKAVPMAPRMCGLRGRRKLGENAEARPTGSVAWGAAECKPPLV